MEEPRNASITRVRVLAETDILCPAVLKLLTDLTQRIAVLVDQIRGLPQTVMSLFNNLPAFGREPASYII